MSARLSACFVGRGALLIRCAEEWRAAGRDILALFSDDPVVADWAAQSDLTLNPAQRVKADYLVVVGEPLDSAENHPVVVGRMAVAFQDSLLPAYAGWHATSRALLHGEKTHGVTWYTRVGGADQILQRVEFSISPDETAYSLDAKCFDAGLDSFRQLVPMLGRDVLPNLRSRDVKPSFYGAERRPPAAGILDFSRKTSELLALARALAFGERANPLTTPKLWTGKTLFCVGAISAAEQQGGVLPGVVLQCDAQGVSVATADGAVTLSRMTTQEGAAISPTQILAVGQQLPILPREQQHLLKQAHEKLAPFEAHWVARLGNTEPLAWPFSSEVKSGNPGWKIEEMHVPGLPESLEERAAVVASFFARIADAESFDIGWCPAERPGEALLSELFAPVVPLLIWIKPDADFPAFSKSFLVELRNARANQTYMRDVCIRQPALRQMGSQRFPVCLSEGEVVTNPDTDLVIELSGGKETLRWRFDASRLSADRVAQLKTLFEDWARIVFASPTEPLRRNPLCEVEDLMLGPSMQYHSERDLTEWVDLAAMNAPESPAVIFESRVMSYGELISLSNRMAALLRERGVGPDTRVGLLMERAPETMVALLGVLKAGGCYVPIDPYFPADRIRYMMEQASLALVLTQPEHRAAVSIECETLPVDSELSLLRNQSEWTKRSGAGPDHLLYVIYTSGSTGRPKGVAMTRRAGMNLVEWQNTLSTSDSRRPTLQYASLGFDVSFQEIFSTWCAGGALVIVPETMRRDPMQLLRLAGERDIARWFMPYAALQQIAVSAAAMELFPRTLRDVITAGEALKITPEIRRFFEEVRECRLHNQYGPSETHVATAYILPKDPVSWPDLPPIGVPIANTSALLLDSEGMPVARGVRGELFLGGDCLARGYLDQPELTDERFVERKWKERTQRYYRTGDFARVNGDGQLEFLGRGDDQVKIRGYRVELEEIEAALNKHPTVHECAVVAHEQGGARQLVAYAVTDKNAVEASALRGYLQAVLPEYMVPALYMFLDRIPLTPSGKIHRRALPAPKQGQDAVDQTPPRTEVEQVLVQLWQQSLGVERVGIQTNFFDLGGDSLKLARVQAGLRTSLKRDVSILEMFRFPTISGLATFLTQGEAATTSVSRPAFKKDADEPIAIVGMAGRFPGAISIAEFWKNVREGRESVTFFKDEEVPGAPPPGSDLKFIKARGVLERCEWFDATLFGMTPREAELTDPQHRVFLESAWEALEHAGCDPSRFAGAIGVFAAASMNTYLLHNALKDRAAAEEFVRAFQVSGYQTLMGNDKDYVATRVAYKLNLRGPSMTVQTACSSSLVAICQACESLRTGMSDLALAGGVSISFPQERGYVYVDGSIASSDGHCRPFDASAAGTVFGSGAAVVALKRLSDAQADGDTIYAVIKGWALNNDGARKAGFMAPSAEGQSEVIRQALDRSGVDPRTIGFVETHGTGTPIGDPIEIAGLTRAFRRETADSGYCALGSVKANIGHLESAAGVTGLIKTALSLYHHQIPPLLHFKQPNPLLDLPATPFYGPRELTAWPVGDAPRRAGVSSFGVGGTNAHVILEEAPLASGESAARSHYFLPLSARTDSALSAAAENLAVFLEQHPATQISNVAYTLDVGRQRMAKRGFVVAQNGKEAIAALRSRALFRKGEPLSGAPSVVFLFPGQGSQHIEMGRDLYEKEAVFRERFDACAAVLRAEMDIDLKGLLFPPAERAGENDKQLTQTQNAQPCIFAIEYALAHWWMSLGVTPAAMIGHSSGEFVPACLAGVFSMEDALRLLIRRGQLMQQQPKGRMLAVRLSGEEVQSLLPPELSIAGYNAPLLTVVSGPSEAIAAFETMLEARGIGAKALQTSHAFHSAMVDPALDPFREVVKKTKRNPASGPFLSTRTGGWISPEAIADAEYWVRQVRDPVRFSAAVREAMKLPNVVFLEVGPSQALTTLAAQHDEAEIPVIAIPSMRRAKEDSDDYAVLLHAVGRLWCAGVGMDTAKLYESPLPCRIALPTYPFERKRFWIEPPSASDAPAPSAAVELESAASVSDAGGAANAEQNRPSDDVLGEILDILQDLSGIDRANIEPTRPFLEMGFDSLFLTQVSLAFQRRFLVKLTLRQMLEELSSPAAISAYIAAHLPAQVSPTVAAAPAASPEARASASTITMAGPFSPEGEASPRSAPSVPTRHGPYAPINKSAGDTLTPAQQEHLDALIARYTKKTQRSKEYTRQHRAHFADPRAVAGFRVTWKEMTYPIVSARSAGSKIWDLDGNEFLDVTMGFGTNLFGHNPDFVREALEQQLQTGIEIGPQSAVAGEVAQAIVALTGMERVTFCNTGSEAVMGAVRAARTVTGRDRIVYFAGDYHGVNDEALAKGQTVQGRIRTLPIAPGIPRDMVSHVLVLPYGDSSSLETIRAEAASIAAILVEPVQSRKPELQPREFLHSLRALTKDLGIALIFDEVITGFRVHPGGAQAWFGVHADLATYGKVIGGGMPIGIIAGRREYMDAFDGGAWNYGDASVPEAGVTFFAGTFVRHPLAMAAARAVVKRLQATGPGLQTELNERTTQFAKNVNDFFNAEGIELKINTFGSLWYFSHGESFHFFSLLFHYLRDAGIHIWEGRPCFISTAHSDADIERLVGAFKHAIAEMRGGGFLPERRTAISEAGAFTLTPGQQEIWLATKLDPSSSPAFNESCTFTMRGPFNRAAMESALQQLIVRHEALRTTFDEDGSTQTVHPVGVTDIEFFDFAGYSAPEREARLSALIREEVSHQFDLAKLPLGRVRITRMESDLHIMILTVHHIVCDGWSYDVMSRDLGELYSKAVLQAPDSPPLPVQFREYARYLDSYSRDDRARVDLDYWLKSLARPPLAIEWPADRPRPPQRTFSGAMEVSILDGAEVAGIRELGAQSRVTLFANILAQYAVLLHRLTGQDDLIIGVPAAGQQLLENGALVGHCVNLLPIRLRIDPEKPFSALLAATQRVLLDAYEHQGLTFGDLIKALQIPRDPARPPLIQTTFNVDPAIHGLRFEGLDTEIVINPRVAYQFEFSFNVVSSADHLRIECNYNTDLFEQATVQRWLGHFRQIVRAVTADPETPVGAIALLTTGERRMLLLEWNQTQTAYPAKCIHEVFEDQVAAAPERIALSFSGETMTYATLNEQANRLARALVRRGVRPNQPVGLCAERSIELIVALLAILKAGGAYLPLDPTHPDERLRLQIADGKIGVVLALSEHFARCETMSVEPILLDGAGAAWRSLPGENLSAEERGAEHAPSQLAYVLYTSGSTGQPKGVLIEHKSVVRLVKGVSYAHLGADERYLQLSPLAFDASTFEIWAPLLNGGRLAILPPGRFAMEGLAHAMETEQVSTLWLTTGLFHTIVDENPDCLKGVKQLLTGGEVTSGNHVARLLARRADLTIIHCYGPTEGTTFTTANAWTRTQTIPDVLPLGRPISNTQVYVLDGRLSPQPVGVAGELYVGGDGVARGYLNRPDLTDFVFIENPFPETPGSRLYRTGDFARWLADGQLEFLGRRDAQVKIRGFRIELGEIESALSSHPNVQSCAVVVRTTPAGDKQLVAYFVSARQSQQMDIEELCAFLRGTLPEFMVPSLFVQRPALPLNASGKIDRHVLAEGSLETLEQKSAVPAAPLMPRVVASAGESAREAVVIETWKQVLGVVGVKRTDDFFALGGHSLAAFKLINRLQEAGYKLEVADLFRNPTVEKLARVLTPLQQENADIVVSGGATLVELRKGRQGSPPLCLLPSDFGDLLIYSNLLPHLDESLSCVGLSCATMYEDDRGIRSLEELARWFIRELKAVQPYGPYLLAGYCFGGLVAMEMARQFMADGEKIGMLALIDARPFNPKTESSEYLRMRLHGALHAKPGDWKRHLSAKFSMWREGKLIDAMARHNPDKLDKRDLNRWVLETRVLPSYHSTEYPGPIMFFYPEESQYELYGDPSCGWLNLAPRVFLHKVTGSHVNMMKEPHVSLLASRLNACIQQAMEGKVSP